MKRPKVIEHLISIGFKEIKGEWKDVWGQGDGFYWHGELERGNDYILTDRDTTLYKYHLNGRVVSEEFLLKMTGEINKQINMPKPIVFLGIPFIFTEEHFKKIVKDLTDFMPDYYVLPYSSEKSEMQVFYEKDFTDIQYEELRMLIEEKLKSLDVEQKK